MSLLLCCLCCPTSPCHWLFQLLLLSGRCCLFCFVLFFARLFATAVSFCLLFFSPLLFVHC